MEGEEANKPEKRVQPTVSAIMEDGTIVELLYDRRTRQTSLAVYDGRQWAIERQIKVGSSTLVPFSPHNNLVRNEVVLLASEPTEYGSESELLAEVQEFIHRYLDLSPAFEKVAAHYVLLTWVYDAFNELPYLRFRGDYGSGKTRALLTIGSICYKAFFASGASTVSPIFHTLDAFRGTLVFDEADFRFSDERAEIVKVLNNGNVQGMPVLRTMMNHQREFNPQAFQVYGPKIVATRNDYDDRGLESRFITQDMGPRRPRRDIPINLPDTFKDEARELRNKLLVFRFRRRADTKLDPHLVDPNLEPRFNQILLPLLSIVSDPAVRADLRSAALEAQASLVAERGLLVEAQVLEILTDLMEDSDRLVIPIAEIATKMIERYGAEYQRPITNRWVGGILRRRLHVSTYKSHGVYVVPMAERAKVQLLCLRYGITTIVDVAPAA